MSDPVRYLTSLAQALARMSLYADGHPVRARAASASYDQLRVLQRDDPLPVFSFMGDAVIYGNRPVRELQGWDWARKLSSVGIQRLEFQPDVSPEEYGAFLSDVVTRLSARTITELRLDDRTPVGGTELIRFGALGVRDADAQAIPAQRLVYETGPSDLSEEAEAVDWMHVEVAEGHGLPLPEAETVVQALAQAMHRGHRIMMPLLALKDFDQYTTTHALNTSVLAMALAEHLGLSRREVQQYGMAGLLHDLGKVKVPVDVLRKPGVLNQEELALMRRHPVDGASLILEYDAHLDLCAAVAFEHHIMIDGGGYPQRQRRCDCHHASMLVHVCDVFDALRTNRPYRVAWEAPAIVDYIKTRIGTEFEPTIARAFVEMMEHYELRDARADLIDGPLEVAASA
jgi:hypothetical protein